MPSFDIIDFHTHPFADASENICNYPEGPSSASDFAACMDRAGIGAFCGSVIPQSANDAPTFEQIHELNLHALRLADFYEGRYIPGITVHPAFVKESCDELEYMKTQGVKLVGELVPYRMGWREYACRESLEIFGVAGELGMTVSMHPTNTEDMEAVVKALPKTTFVFAHPGEKAAYMAHLERMEKYPNAYLDLSGTGLFRYAMLAHGVNRLGAERFLFGTDFPVCNASMQVGGILSEYLRPEDYALIFSGNARRLLGL